MAASAFGLSLSLPERVQAGAFVLEAAFVLAVVTATDPPTPVLSIRILQNTPAGVQWSSLLLPTVPSPEWDGGHRIPLVASSMLGLDVPCQTLQGQGRNNLTRTGGWAWL